MADEIRLVTFEGENVAPINDALMWDVAIGDSGVIYGCETTIKNASTLHIEAGYGVICGRHFQIFESDIPVTLSPGGDLLGRLYIHMDLSDASEPVQLLVETDASLTPEEQDANINIINGIWDMNLATFALNAVTISDLQNVFPIVAGGGSNLIAGTETGPTASEAYVSGQYIIWGSRLWKVIDAIAVGDQFVIGSNLSASSTTVGNELTGLNNSLTASDDLKFQFATDGEGNYGYLDGDDTFVPFSKKKFDWVAIALPDYPWATSPCRIINSNGDVAGDKVPDVVNALNNGFCDFIGSATNGGNNNSIYAYVSKAGYYCLANSTYGGNLTYFPIYLQVGNMVNGGAYGCVWVYLGETNPFE